VKLEKFLLDLPEIVMMLVVMENIRGNFCCNQPSYKKVNTL